MSSITLTRYVVHMPKTVQIRNVPDRIHRIMVRRAKQEVVSYPNIFSELAIRLVERPTMDAIEERLAILPPGQPEVVSHKGPGR